MGWGVPEQGWRKGPWTPEEDKLLHQYVNLHGDGKWSSVAKSTGLKRSGKSCRLRWVNYLRPGLKRGQITPQEEAIIIELHSLWGNKWSTIARYLPGRTDNEIKNYWRTHFKKKEKGGPSQKERRKEYQMLKQKQKQDDHGQHEEEEEEEEDDDTNDLTVEASANSASAINGKNVMIEGQGTREENNNNNNNNTNNNNMVFMYGSNYYSWEDQNDEQCWPVMSHQDVAAASWSESSMGEEGLWSGLWNLDDLSTAHYHTNNNSNLPTQNSTHQEPQYNSSYSGVGDAPTNCK